MEGQNRLTSRFAELVPHPATVIDVGVGPGTPWLYKAFPNTEFLLIDPMPECEAQVREAYPTLAAKFHGVALGAEDGEAELNIPSRDGHQQATKASLMRRSSIHAKAATSWERRRVPVRRLDDLTADVARPLGLKIDAEGAEYDILRGAPQTLARCAFVVLELSLAKRFDEVQPPSLPVALLAEAGLELRDVLAQTGSGPDRSPKHIDALFTRWVSEAQSHQLT